MKVKGLLAVAVGLIQSAVGASAITLAYFLYNDFFDVRTIIRNILTVPVEEYLPLYLLILFTTGFFSMVSGFFLIHEWLKLRGQSAS